MNEFNEIDNQYSNVPVNAAPVTPTSSRVLGYVTLGLGITSLCSFFAGLPFAIAGLITAGIGRKKNYGRETKPMHIGKILSIIGIPVSILSLILYIVLLANFASGPHYTSDFSFFLHTLGM